MKNLSSLICLKSVLVKKLISPVITTQKNSQIWSQACQATKACIKRKIKRRMAMQKVEKLDLPGKTSPISL